MDTCTPELVQRRQLLRMERKALNSMKWNLMAITASNFVQHILLCLFIPSDDLPQVRKHANIFVKTSITNPKYVIRCQSLIAGVSIYTAIMRLKMLIKPWPGFTTSLDKIFKTINR